MFRFPCYAGTAMVPQSINDNGGAVHSPEATWYTVNHNSQELVTLWTSQMDAKQNLPQRYTLLQFSDASALAEMLEDAPFDGIAIDPDPDRKFDTFSMAEAFRILRGN